MSFLYQASAFRVCGEGRELREWAPPLFVNAGPVLNNAEKSTSARLHLFSDIKRCRFLLMIQASSQHSDLHDVPIYRSPKVGIE